MAALDAHAKRQILGRGVVVAVTNGHLDSSTERSVELTPRARQGLQAAPERLAPVRDLQDL